MAQGRLRSFPFAGVGLTARAVPLAGSRDHVRRTLELIRAFVSRDTRRPSVRARALEIRGECPDRDGGCLAGAIESWLRARLRFVRDPVDTEYVQDFAAFELSGAGDCDDFTTAAATLGGALGMPSRAVLVTRRGDDAPCHIYAELLDRRTGRWHPVDPTTEGGVPLPATVHRRRVMLAPAGRAFGDPPRIGWRAVALVAAGLYFLSRRKGRP